MTRPRVSLNCQDGTCEGCSGCEHHCHPGQVPTTQPSAEAARLLREARDRLRRATEATRARDRKDP